MRVCYIGNFDPPHSTENHVRQALLDLGHTVETRQENHGPTIWQMNMLDYDVILWTRTGWVWENPEEIYYLQLQMLERAKHLGTPTVGYHLDRWWGLPREQEILTEPFFRCSLVVTADGGHEQQWADVRVNHRWMPPAVSKFECVPGTFDSQYVAEIAFVGSWNEYHPEWEHRFQLVEFLRQRGARFWPQLGMEAVRGDALRNLYATTKVNVGDSCLLGGATHYWSDRIPETLGRGGFLIHPDVVGLDQHFVPGEHLATWPLGDWNALDNQLSRALIDPAWRAHVASQGQEHVLENHTYSVRMRDLFGAL